MVLGAALHHQPMLTVYSTVVSAKSVDDISLTLAAGDPVHAMF